LEYVLKLFLIVKVTHEDNFNVRKNKLLNSEKLMGLQTKSRTILVKINNLINYANDKV